MYEIYETFGSDIKSLSYYTVGILYNRSLDKRKNLQFKIYDDLTQPNFIEIANGNKSIIYDHVRAVLNEFGLNDLSDERLWNIIIITTNILNKKSNCLTHVVLDETFKNVERYFQKEGMTYRRLGKYNKPNLN